MLVKLVQDWNEEVPMLVTLLGIVKRFRPVPANALSPMLVMLLGMVILVTLLET